MQPKHAAERLKDRRALKQTYVEKIEQYEAKLAKVEDEIQDLREIVDGKVQS